MFSFTFNYYLDLSQSLIKAVEMLHWLVFLTGKAQLIFAPLLKIQITEIFLATDGCNFFCHEKNQNVWEEIKKFVQTAGEQKGSLCADLSCKLGAYL